MSRVFEGERSTGDPEVIRPFDATWTPAHETNAEAPAPDSAAEPTPRDSARAAAAALGAGLIRAWAMRADAA